MNIHEFEAKIILRRYGINIPDFAVVSSLGELPQALETLSLHEGVLKIQVHAGGRGKGGGVKLAKSRQEIMEQAKGMLGMKFINNQTGTEGITVSKLLISPLVDFKKEYYVGAIIDREKGQACLIASPEGGMDIEEIAEQHPEKIKTMPISLQGTLRNYQLLELAKFMGWKGGLVEQGKNLLKAVAKAFIETDASLLEINPLVETTHGELVALDAKLSIDDNALYRQPAIAEFYDASQISATEAQARKHDLAYVSLEGNIGCMVNGAGLAMATMDIIKLAGGMPANFLDVGGGATSEKIAEGFKIILQDPNVKAILVNIFGGIMNCKTLAEGIISAIADVQLHVPLIVRMEGTNVEQGKEILHTSKLNIILAKDLGEAAEKAVAAAGTLSGGSHGSISQ